MRDGSSRVLWVAVQVHAIFGGRDGIELEILPLAVADSQDAAARVAAGARERIRAGRPIRREREFTVLELVQGELVIRDLFFVAPAPVLEVPAPLQENVAVVFRVDARDDGATPTVSVVAIVPSVGEYVTADDRRGHVVLPCRRTTGSGD